MKRILPLLLCLFVTLGVRAQLPKVYDETIDPLTQIDQAVAQAAASGKHVVCQVGGNWCPWCLRLADFVKRDTAVAHVIADNYVYIHVNYPTKATPEPLLKRLGNPGRFGYPVLVVLDGKGRVIHIQDSSLLEEGKGYDPKKVLRFLKLWTPAAYAPGLNEGKSCCAGK